MSAWILIATSILITLLVSLALAEWLCSRISSYAGQRRKWTSEMARTEAHNILAAPADGRENK